MLLYLTTPFSQQEFIKQRIEEDLLSFLIKKIVLYEDATKDWD
ncbi:hypothetical protein [Alphaproteobacteria bacterium endosymbiont of Tiliacea citrago]